MTSSDLLVAISRATLFTSLSIGVAWLLAARVRAASPRIVRLAWFMAMAQGWLLFPWTMKIESFELETQSEHTVTTSTGTMATLGDQSELTFTVGNTTEQATAFDWSTLTVYILGAWICGGMAMVIVRAHHYACFVRRLPAQIEDDACESVWYAEWQQQLSSAGARRPAEFHLTHDLGPLICFVPFRYLVLAPRALWAALTRPERDAILRHELAHLTRRDVWKSLAIRFVALPQWFNPFVWKAVRAFDEAGEWACDDEVARAHRDGPLHLARSLVQAAEFVTTGVPASASAQGGVLSRRIRRLVTPQIKERSMMKRLALFALLAVLIGVQSIRIERVAAAPQQADVLAEAKTTPAPPPSSTALPMHLEQRTRPWTGKEPYVIEPPDILTIKAHRLVPKRNYKIGPADGILVRAVGVAADAPIENVYVVDPEGRIDLGPTYGRVRVVDLTIDDARDEVRRELSKIYRDVEVTTSLALSSGTKQIAGEHLVGPDGRINLGEYGNVDVAGRTIEEAIKAIESQLSSYLDNPQLTVDLFAVNSKRIYIVTQGGQPGDNVTSVQFTGNETVLDAVAQFGGAPKGTRIWIARPNRNGPEQILPVSWNEISEGGSTKTNHQLLPGDRLYISETGGPPAAKPSTQPNSIIHRAVPTGATNSPPPAIVAQEGEDGQLFPMQMVAAENGATVATAMALVKRWLDPTRLAKSPIVLQRRIKNGHVEEDQELKIVWDAKSHGPTNVSNHTLQPGDMILIRSPRSKPADDNAPILPTVKYPPPYDRPVIVQLKSVTNGKPRSVAELVPLDGETVSGMLGRINVWPNPVSFANADISVLRFDDKGVRYIRPVAWDAATRKPTAETDHKLRSGDVIAIVEGTRSAPAPGGTYGSRDVTNARALPNPSSATTMPATAAQALPQAIMPDPAAGKTLVQYRAMVFQDTSGSMSEFKADKDSPMPMHAVVDTAAINPILRILQHNNFISFMSRPSIIAIGGEPAKFSIGQLRADGQTDEIEVKLEVSEANDQIATRIQCKVVELGRTATIDTVAKHVEGKSVIIEFARPELPPGTNAEEIKYSAKPIYLVLTPENIRRAPKASTVK